MVNSLDTCAVWQSCGMTTAPPTTRYTNHRFPTAIIRHALGLYFRFCPSCCDVEELLYERGETVALLYRSPNRLISRDKFDCGKPKRVAASV
jgi:putative transposase